MGFMKILDRVCVRHSKDLHPSGFRTADTRDGVLNHQAGFGGDGLLLAWPIQGIEGVEKGLRIGLSFGHVFCAGDVKKFFLEPCLFKDHFDFMAEGAGRDGQGVGGGGFAHKLANPGENSEMILHRF
jgi:hypothetical protein